MSDETQDANDWARAGGRFDADDAETMDPMPPPSWRTIGDLLEPAFERFARRAAGAELPVPLPWNTVGRALGGPKNPGLPNGLHVIVGNTKSGKSQFAIQAALHAAQQGTPVLYIALELGEDDLVARVAGVLTRKKWSRLWLGEDAKEVAEVRAAAEESLRDLPLAFEVAPPYEWTYLTLRDRAERFRRRYAGVLDGADGKPHRPFLLVLDFLQIVQGEGREDLRERIQKASYYARDVARRMHAAVLLISSTARENYGRLEGREADGNGKGKRHQGEGPKLGEGDPGRLIGLGKESGEIEFSADSVLVLAREPWPLDPKTNAPRRPESSTVWLAVAGARAVLPSWVLLRFNGGWFTDAESA